MKGKCFLLPALILLLAACSGSRGAWLLQSDRPAFEEMIADLRQARVVFVGEFHDRREHHQLQLEIIKALHRQGVALTIGLEMFDMESQPALDHWVKGRLPLQEFVAAYRQSWSIDWAEYDAILLFARNNGIPLVGLDAPGDIVRKVTRLSFNVLSAEELARLPRGVDVTVSDSYREFMGEAFRGHEIPEAFFANFCQAQALRNSTMARLTGEYLSRHPERLMVVITGVGHAMRRGAAAQVGKEPGLKSRVVVPVVEGMFDALDEDDADYFVIL